MSSLALALILLSALLHAGWNALVKREPNPVSAAMAVLLLSTALAAVAMLVKGESIRQPALGWALAAGLGEAGYFATLALALRSAPLGQVYAIARGGALLCVWPVSVLWLGERIDARSLGGVVTIAIGLLALQLRRGEARSAGHTRGLLWAAVSAAFIGSYNLAYKRALGLGAPPMALFATSLATALPLDLAGLGSTRREIWPALRTRWATIGLAALGCTGSFWLYLACLNEAGAGEAVTLRNSSVLFTQAFAWGLGEKISRQQLAGASLVALGAILLAWPH